MARDAHDGSRKRTARPVGPTAKEGLHPRSRHRGRYDFARLIAASPGLGTFVVRTPHGDESIDFADPQAVRALNRAILAHAYGIADWDIPAEFLCPAIPGRAEYLHHAADLLGSCNGDAIPRGAAVRVLDIGVGANCVYPLIGHREYGWSFVGADIDSAALAAAERIVRANTGLADAIALRRQPSPSRIFAGVVRTGETFDLTLCNPPFHGSREEAEDGSRRKWRNLGREPAAAPASPALNFGGRQAELWCPGGESGFVQRMIAESALIPKSCFWFTSLIAKESSLPAVRAALRAAQAADIRIIDVSHGQKRSRIVAWTFLTGMQQSAWRQVHWTGRS